MKTTKMKISKIKTTLFSFMALMAFSVSGLFGQVELATATASARVFEPVAAVKAAPKVHDQKMAPAAHALAGTPLTTQLLTGHWLIDHSKSTDEKLVYTRKKEDEMRWGTYVTFDANAVFSAGHSAPCGNDSNIRHESGRFKVKGGDRLMTTIDVEGKGKLFTIASVDEEVLVLVPLG